MYNILLVEDSDEFAHTTANTLGAQYSVHRAADLKSARALLTKASYDLILLDVVLPDGNGFDFCTEIKANSEFKTTPVVFMSGRSEVQDKVMGWSLGADDYIVKPFSPLELRSRIQNRIEKYRQKIDEKKTLRWNSVTLDLSFHQAKIEEDGAQHALDLTNIEFKILSSLVRNPERILSRAQIIESAWGTNVNIGERSVDKHVSSLRKKFNSRHVAIRTVSGIGYRLVKR